ncbi:MAG: hypothetical protein LBK67_04150 [Coriobacteriales bacterium]|jgi:hypothetical protein|nr:hypothetical protein [Coriobacteriales bacterium]
MGLKGKRGEGENVGAAQMERRGFVALSAVGIGTLAVGGLAGCGNGILSSKPVEQEEPKEPSVEEQELQQASEEWDVAYGAAETSWSSLQDAISSAENKQSELAVAIITNPESLGEFDQRLVEANALRDQHSDATKPEQLADLREGTENLNKVVSAYEQMEELLRNSLYAVKVFNPLVGEFDVTDKVGFSFHVTYKISDKPSVIVDTSRGNPGEVVVEIMRPAATITVTNTTPGKQTSFPNMGSLLFLLPDGQITNTLNSLPPAKSLSEKNTLRYALESLNHERIYTFTESLPAGIRMGNDELEGEYETHAGPCYEVSGLNYFIGFGQYSDSREGALEVGGKHTLQFDPLSTFLFTIPEVDKDLFVEIVSENIKGVVVMGTQSYGVVGFGKGMYFYNDDPEGVTYFCADGYTMPPS